MPFTVSNIPSIIRNSKQRTQNNRSLQKTAFEAKGRQYTTGKVIQRLFNIDLYTHLAIYRYRYSKKEIQKKDIRFFIGSRKPQTAVCGLVFTVSIALLGFLYFCFVLPRCFSSRSALLLRPLNLRPLKHEELIDSSQITNSSI